MRILGVENNNVDQLAIGKSLNLRVTAQLGPFAPDEVALQVRFGALDVTSQIYDAQLVRVVRGQPGGQSGVYIFEGSLASDRAGSFGFSVRLVPVIHGVPRPSIPGLITWWE